MYVCTCVYICVYIYVNKRVYEKPSQSYRTIINYSICLRNRTQVKYKRSLITQIEKLLILIYLYFQLYN